MIEETDELCCPTCDRSATFIQRVDYSRRYGIVPGKIVRRPDGLQTIEVDMQELWCIDYDEEAIGSDEGELWCDHCCRQIPYEARYST